VAVGLAISAGITACTKGGDTEATLVEHGRYMVQIAGCNDCHTAGYALAAGKVDEKLWLLGDTVGWQGPWGTTYPINLRLFVSTLTEEQWLAHVRKMESRPPMPWFNMRAMTDRDLKGIYQYLRHLGPSGQAAPAYEPPGTEARPPVFKFVVEQPPAS
jgi:mono/diheme cytochrome c family protein